MLWVRHLEGLADAPAKYEVTAELASESRIVGVLSYADGAVLAGPCTLQPDDNGLLKYQIKLTVPQFRESRYEPGSRKGYIYCGGPVGELAVLLSLHLEARIFVLSTTIGELSSQGMPVKTEHRILRGGHGPLVDPVIFSNSPRNFATTFPNVLNQIRILPVKHHLAVTFAAHHYARALREIGVDTEMAFIRLVSAVEALSKDETIKDSLVGVQLDDVIRQEALTEEQYKELEGTLAVRKSKARFLSFFIRYAEGFLSREPAGPAHTQVTMNNLEAVLTAVYRARSRYLHVGDPMYLSGDIQQFPNWHMDPSVGMQMDNRHFPVKDKLPRLSFFHRFVRYCILKRLSELSGENADV